MLFLFPETIGRLMVRCFALSSEQQVVDGCYFSSWRQIAYLAGREPLEG